MDYNINFPNLGIFLKHVGKSINIGNFSIAYYGIVIASAMMIGLLIAQKRAKETGQNPERYVDLFIYMMIFGIVGARLYYVAFSFDSYKDRLVDIFNLRQGGLAIYGGIIGGVLTVLIFAKIRNMNVGTILDTVAMGVCNGQMLGRWGNFFNREAFGEYTNNLFAMQLPVSAVRPWEITETMKANQAVLDGVTYIQVHPTFLYESLWNAGVLLIVFFTRNKTKFRGELFARYIGLYALGRLWIEGLRTDQLLIPGTRFAVSQGLSGVLAAGCLILTAVLRKKAGKEKKEA
ncbi:MAG: prolipoprotein diacylglyceryl transferase [Lachnospiraceae bacterium]|nr:prolipoprotein diacylglyceryl transferase [Lachnospiraceae bacterium]